MVRGGAWGPGLPSFAVSWVDAVILVWVLLAALRGRALGALTQVFGLLGFVAGLLGGALLFDSAIAKRLPVGIEREVVTVVVVLGVAMIGAALGHVVGRWSNVAMRRLHLGAVDAIAGAVVGGAGALLSAWLVAGLFAQSSIGWLDRPIQSSAVLTTVDRVMPPLPSVIGRAEAFFSTDVFPQVFANLIQPQPSPVPVPSSATALALVGARAHSVLKVLAEGSCGATREGTSFVVSASLVITDAHVVAGEPAVYVLDPTPTRARVVLFDPELDVAILSVPGLHEPSIGLVTSVAPRGAYAAVVGYPEGGPLNAQPAGVEGAFLAVGRDIYGANLVTRQVYAIASKVLPGNSGSPLLVAGGAIGMVFSRSLSQSGTGYALRASGLASDVQRARSARGSVGDGACTPG